MWRMLHGAPHWEVSAKKMWSPGPPATREPVRLPFLDVTPTTVLQRLRDAPDGHHPHHAHHTHLEDDRGLALWTTDTIELNRTAPSDLGYSLLPNKYGVGGGGGGGLGSARGGERPSSRSPSLPRRINALAPLDQGDNLVLTRAASTRGVIPPLSAVSRRSLGHDLRHPSHPQDFDEEEDDDTKSDIYDDDEGEDEVSEGREEEEDMDGQVSRPKSSATTRDSGISVFSGANDGEASAENGKVSGKDSRGAGTARMGERRRGRRRYTPKGHPSPSSPLPSSASSALSSGDEHGRSSYDGVHAGGRRKGDAASPSRRSLPNDALLGVVGKGIPGGRSRATPPKDKDFRNFDYESDFETDEEDIKLANTTLTKMKLLRNKQENMKEIERRRLDRESRRAQEERVKKYRQLELQHSQNSLQPSSADSVDSKLAVQPSMSYKRRNTNLRRSPKPSPSPSPTSLARIPKSKSHNANLSRKFSKAPEKRHRSLERNANSQVNSVNPRDTFSRTPQLVKRGQPPDGFMGGGGDSGGGQMSNSYGTATANKRYARQTPERNQQQVRKALHPGPKGVTVAPRNRRTTVSPPNRSSPAGAVQDVTPTNEKLHEFRAESRTPDYPASLMESAGLRIAKPASSCFKKNLDPLASPPDALRSATERLSSNDWESQVEAIEMLVRLSRHHPDMLLGSLRSINMSLMKQAKNLRSQVSRAAIQAFTYFFDHLKRNMEADSEKIAAILLNKTVDTNKFLQLDSHHALDSMVENISPSKAIPAIIQEGLGHRNPAVKTTVARLLAYEVERLGASRVLSGQKDITDRILPATAKLAQEGSLKTRQYAKQVFQHLIRQGQFDVILKKYVPANDIRNLQKLLDNLSSEGRPVHDSARYKFASGSRYTRTM